MVVEKVRSAICLVAKDTRNGCRKHTQDDRERRRYCRRWQIEEIFAWRYTARNVTIEKATEYALGQLLLT